MCLRASPSECQGIDSFSSVCIVILHICWCCQFNMLCIFFFVSSLIVDSMSSLCYVKMQSMKVFPACALKVKPNLSGPTLERFCQIYESNPYFLESCCTSPHSGLCVLLHLIYKVSIEICMRPMMPALKIHSNREYIDSSVIELSLSFLCHGSHTSLSRLMYYQKHAAPPSLPPPLFLRLSNTHLFFLFHGPHSLFTWHFHANAASSGVPTSSHQGQNMQSSMNFKRKLLFRLSRPDLAC